MEIFTIIEQVLDELYEQIEGDEKHKDAEVNASLDMLGDSYKRLTSKNEPIDYSNPATRLAYIYKYVTCHSNLVFSRIAGTKCLRRPLEEREVRVSCIGGGPGSDFLGILKYCILSKKNIDLKCSLFDRETAWSESWEDVDDKIQSSIKLRTRTLYVPLDVTNPATYAEKVKYLKQSDLFTMIYFASEVYRFREDGADDYFDDMFSRMREGALLLYIDNNHPEFTNWMDEKFQKHGLKILDSGSGTEKMPTDEEKRDLGKYYNRFSSSPKLEADVCRRVAKKG